MTASLTEMGKQEEKPDRGGNIKASGHVALSDLPAFRWQVGYWILTTRGFERKFWGTSKNLESINISR